MEECASSLAARVRSPLAGSAGHPEGCEIMSAIAKLDVSVRTVARKLDAIRVIWQKEPGDEAT